MRIINVILFTIAVFLIGCYTVHLETFSDDPILRLKQKYSLHLDTTWTTKQASPLLKIFESFSTDLNFHPSIWKISDNLEEDIKIEFQNSLKSVTINSDVFPVEGSEQDFSAEKRLFYAAVQFITENGTNTEAIKLIIKDRYGISVDIPSYDLLTQRVTQETAEHYSDFENEDLMLFISILEEFPQALHKIPELRYVVRRIDDKIRAPGLAWTSEGYIELSQTLFTRDFPDDTRRLIAHEKSHFLWTYLFSDQLKQDWAKLGGWQKDLKSESGWSTTKNREEFVTDYAYQNNPNEDLAESIGFYLVYPDKLRSCSSAKYDFIHNRIMLMYGERYISPDMMQDTSFSGISDHLLRY
ncbi:MAG: hypothetical protein OXI67_17410 [Candidatus Poribacteria bacterium]|nr:hypothetical protein [Candidatus Poribacteria bacterium]